MRPPSRVREHGLRFNITPLIDVVFLLIIFFLAASHFARSEDVVPEEIEQVTVDEPAEDEDAADAKRLVVTITATDRMYVRGAIVPTDRVRAMIAEGVRDFGEEFEVRLRCDRRARFGLVEPLLLTCAEAGVRDLKFTVQEE